MKNKFIISVFILTLFAFTGFTNNAPYSKKVPKNSDSLKSVSSSLARTIVETFQELKVPGAIVGVFIGGYEPFAEPFGVQNLELNQPIVLYDKMRIGSITKTFTGTVLLQLVDEGKISLSDKLSKYYPDFPNGDNITIQMLGDMRSGIYNYTEDSVFQADFFKDMSLRFTPEELIAVARKHPPYFPPDSSFHYSNTNTILLGLIIEKLTGNSLQSEIQNRILNPLGMKETTFATDSSFPDPHAHGYLYMDSTSAEPTDVTYLDPSWAWSAGALISTLADLVKYAKPLATGELISKKAQDERLEWDTEVKLPGGTWEGTIAKYGFAIAGFDGAIGHNGGIPGFNSFMGYLPEKDATIIVLVNMQDNKAGIGPADYIARKIIEFLKSM